MKTEIIEQRLKDIKNEINLLDSLKNAYDETNIHEIEYQIQSLIIERTSLNELLEKCFDKLIGL
jgi:hypothetical protein